MPEVAIIGGGPAGLMAAEKLAQAGVAVTVYEHKPSPGRKFLMAGRGGLNLTHSEDLHDFILKYGEAAEWLRPYIEKFPPSALRAWCEGLGEPTFVGSSGRVFPQSFKASPLLRAWMTRLEGLGVKFRMGWRWAGWDEGGALVFENGEKVKADAVFLALGGASWPRLGSDGGWVDILKGRGVDVRQLKPANCGFTVEWTELFARRFAGQPLKSVALSYGRKTVQGEIMIAEKGIEGGAVYALSALLRDEIERKGRAVLDIDLRPDLSKEDLTQRLSRQRGRQSFLPFVRKVTGLSDAASGLLMEHPERRSLITWPPEKLAALIKAFPLILTAPFSIERAISSAGGVARDAVAENLMLKSMPGVFVAGEMLDWEAPTGGYLLQATFATAIAAAEGVMAWLGNPSPRPSP